MKIIIDARSINQGGVGSTLLSFLENIDFNENEYSLIGDRKILDPFKFPCKIIHSKSKPYTFRRYHDINLAKVINDYDCFFTPDFVVPVGVKINSYFIVHDLLFIDNKSQNKSYFKDARKRHYLKESYAKAKKIFVVSNYVKNKLEEYFGKYKEIIVLQPGIPNLIKNALNETTKIEKKNYILYVGTLKRHKNFKSLLEAQELNHWNTDLHIVVQTSNLSSKEKRYIKKLKKFNHIKILKDLTPKEYAMELSEAQILVQPSFYEGYSTAINEALYFKTKVIVADIPIYHEIYNKNTVAYFDPKDPSQLAKLLTDNSIKNKKINEEFWSKFDNKKMHDTIIENFEEKNTVDHLRRNFIFNAIYQVLVILTPLITAPYVARVLGTANIGQFSFAYTIICYFIIFSSLGFQQYAQRAIAEAQHDREKQSVIFWQIILVRLLPVVLCLSVLYVLYYLNVFGEYSPLIIYLSIIVAGSAFDINFYFHGKENFFLVMAANLIIRIIFLVCVFYFVNSRYDLWLYTFLYALMVFTGYITMWIALPFNLRKVKIKHLDFKKHIKASLSLFLPVAAVGIYAIVDKTIIGVLINGQTYQQVGYITVIANISDLENGYYFQAERIIKAIFSILLAIGTVMTTRNSIEFSSKHTGTVKNNIYKSFKLLFAIGVPLAFGTIAVANCFVPMFFGKGYEKTALLLMVYAPVVLLSASSNILGMQYLLTTKRDNKYALSVLIGILINVLCNIFLIPFYGALGAVIGTLISEFIIMFIQINMVRKELSFSIVFKGVYKYLIAGGVMLTVLLCSYYFLIPNIPRINNLYAFLILLGGGALIYYFVLLILRDDYIFEFTKITFKNIINIFRQANRNVLHHNEVATSLLSSENRSKSVKTKEIVIKKYERKNK